MRDIPQGRLEQYPTIDDLRQRAKRRLPLLSWEYLDMGTGNESAVSRNRQGLEEVTLLPQFFKGVQTINVETELFGRVYNAPFGVAPVGLTGLIWPNAEKILAKTALSYQFPYCLSTVASQTPETMRDASQLKHASEVHFEGLEQLTFGGRWIPYHKNVDVTTKVRSILQVLFNAGK